MLNKKIKLQKKIQNKENIDIDERKLQRMTTTNDDELSLFADSSFLFINRNKNRKNTRVGVWKWTFFHCYRKISSCN